MQTRDAREEVSRLQLRIKELMELLEEIKKEYASLKEVHAKCGVGAAQVEEVTMTKEEADREMSSSHEETFKLTPEMVHPPVE